MTGLRVVVTGATGNVGTAVVRALDADDRIETVLGLARRPAEWMLPKLDLHTTDLADTPAETLTGLFRGADAVIHLAWLFQPTRDPALTWRSNVLGAIAVFRAAAAAGVGTLVHGSSVGAYSPAESTVDEDGATHGCPTAAYSREKAYLERFLDAFELRHPDTRVVRIRSAFVFQRGAASEQRRLFAGPFVPGSLIHLLPAVPDVPGLRFQAVHSADLADAYLRAVCSDVRGAVNVAADPVIDPELLAGLLDARTVRMPAWALRSLVAAAWRLHAVPASPGLVDMLLGMPLMDCGRARDELGWQPRHTATEAVAELIEGLRTGAGFPTAPLVPKLRGGREAELRTGVGERP
ncbi:NAD-dependent epimerase/dehydratase family protein [Amycolatopsis suaedae]|uniref:NAD-dependent epimerase/dehydratase family protein n=1 Tax=Amycolatopsis suaedae TaxID=2510978 RepID=A0A4Q7J1Y4_9PSEU|nr:NAD-dependent epimerase/dehydratase family protein [Amycolatopsis suaedae]RZQ60516.1 NAD-dependent epimerase/dehydratase family protein [Amycolatopsis suaedae]